MGEEDAMLTVSTIHADDSNNNTPREVMFDKEQYQDEDSPGFDEALHNRETVLVNRSKLVVYIFLLVAATAVGVITYVFLEKEEQKWYDDEFEEFAEEIFETTNANVLKAEQASQGFSQTMTSHSTHIVDVVTGSRFPNETLPNFGVRASNVLDITKSDILAYAPLVKKSELEQFDAYAQEHQGWIAEDLATTTISEEEETDMNIIDPGPIPTRLHGGAGQSQPSQGDVLVPIWQFAPVPQQIAGSPILLDLMTIEWFPAALEEMLNTSARVLSPPILRNPFLTAVQDEDVVHIVEETPYTLLLQPVFLDFFHDEIVAVIVTAISWVAYFDDMLEGEARGVLIDVEYVSEVWPHSTYTFEITPTGQANYVGMDFQHDPKYHYKMQRQKLGEPGDSSDDISNSGSSDDRRHLHVSVDDDDGKGVYFLSVHSSDTFVEFWHRDDPIVYTAIVVSIFLFVSLVFLLYDRFVEKRQRKLVHNAMVSRENVLLLDKMVKERTGRLESTNVQLEEANQKIVQASALQLQHFACMSHEIRTPLNCIIGLSSLMEESDDLNPMQKDSLEMITSSGNLLRAVVDDVLDFSKLETGNVEVDIKRSNLQQTLSSVVHSVGMRGLATDVTVNTLYDPLVPEFIQTDIRRIQQILYNLLGNAVKFSQKGATVDLQVSIGSPGFDPGAYSPPPPENTPSPIAHPSNKVLRLAVTDHGKGIHSSDYHKIFQPFTQTGGEKADNEQVHGGTGLGLPITVKLIHGLGGRIAVESQPGAWTKFTVDLPFQGEVVDLLTIAARLKHVPIFLVTNEADTKKQIGESLLSYYVECHQCVSMTELIPKAKRLSNGGPVVCLIQENLFDRARYSSLVACAQTAVITFGSDFVVRDVEGHHRSLTKMLPSALVSSMLTCLEQSLAKKKEAPAPLFASMGSSTATTVSSECTGQHYCALRYLIAEDNLINQKVLRRILERLGIKEIEIVDNGKKAVDREAETEFDVVLMDMQMPVMDGIDACRLIMERRGGHPKAKVIFVSAHVQESFKDECLRAGAVGYLAKPCTLQGVKQRLEECL